MVVTHSEADFNSTGLLRFLEDGADAERGVGEQGIQLSVEQLVGLLEFPFHLIEE